MSIDPKKTRRNADNKRQNKLTVTFDDRELKAIDDFMRLKGYESRSAVIREGAVRFAVGHLIDDGTKLFDDDGTPRNYHWEKNETKTSVEISTIANENEQTGSLFDFAQADEQ